jgi:hypothetical protein
VLSPQDAQILSHHDDAVGALTLRRLILELGNVLRAELDVLELTSSDDLLLEPRLLRAWLGLEHALGVSDKLVIDQLHFGLRDQIFAGIVSEHEEYTLTIPPIERLGEREIRVRRLRARLSRVVVRSPSSQKRAPVVLCGSSEKPLFVSIKLSCDDA